MNFLAHYLVATRFLTPIKPLPFYVVGTALPDLLPLATRRSRLRPAVLEQAAVVNAGESALRAGVAVHLATDTAFHKTHAFAEAQSEVGVLLQRAKFDGMRVRRFFLSHVLTEMALDAVLLRADASIADEFYAAFAAANTAAITLWTESAVGAPLPELSSVLTRFGKSRYLIHYAEDQGVATGLSRLCGRARQDPFEGANFQRLTAVVAEVVQALSGKSQEMLTETAAVLHPLTTLAY